jgi:hypothetical protein
MVLDACDWRHVRTTWGTRWFILANDKGREYVAGRPPKRRLARWTSTLLARLLTGAKPGELVRYRDGDPLNLRRANLVLLDREAARAWQRGQVVTARPVECGL